MTTTEYREYRVEEYSVKEEPFYAPLSDEVAIFTAAYKQKIPVLLKGPTGVGKTRFIEYMAWRLSQPLNVVKSKTKKPGPSASGNGMIPLVTVACHEDLTASDLIGRYLLDANGTRWIDGPMTRAVKTGAILYLDEVVEARKDTTVLIHPLTDHRRILPVETTGTIIEADDRFLPFVSYHPVSHSALKDLKPSPRQNLNPQFGEAFEFSHSVLRWPRPASARGLTCAESWPPPRRGPARSAPWPRCGAR